MLSFGKGGFGLGGSSTLEITGLRSFSRRSGGVMGWRSCSSISEKAIDVLICRLFVVKHLLHALNWCVWPQIGHLEWLAVEMAKNAR